MSLKLYFSPGACSFVPHVLLEASGAAYEPVMVKLHKGEQYGDAYKAINPRSQVPVLVHDANVITQIVAITLYLDMLFPGQHFLPSSHLARAQALSTLAWMNNTVHPTFTHYFMPGKFTDQPEAQAALVEAASTYASGSFTNAQYSTFQSALGNNNFVITVTEFRDDDGRLVAEARSTAIETGRAPVEG